MTFFSQPEIEPTDAVKFAEFQPLIDKYNREKWDQMERFDPEFYRLCQEKIPSAAELDSEPINARVFVTEPGLLSDSEREIVNELTIDDLLRKQLSRELTAEQIARAYIKSAIIAQFATNCVMQFLIPSALERAKELDEYLREHGELLGPMHGIPISLKEQMGYEGQPTTASYVSLIENVVKKSTVSNQIFYKLGGVYHARTSQPQTIMHLDTWNNIIGRTRNPCCTRLSPGGSSGGESAMVAMHGSAIGIGSDIGGSVRCPAAFTNLFGLKPTTKRLSSMNGVSGSKGQESIPSTEGPVARSIEEIEHYMNVYINQGKPWTYDPTSLPIPWEIAATAGSKPRIGILYTDNLVTPYPAIKRAMTQIAQHLEPSFHIIDLSDAWFTEQEMLSIYSTNLSLYTVDGNKSQLEVLLPSGEPLLPLTKHFLNFGGGKELSVYENRKLNILRDTARLSIFEKFFSRDAPASLQLDFILSPANVAPAEIPGNSKYWGYTSLWNLTDYPNVVFPTPCKQDPQQDILISESLNKNEFEKMVWYKQDGTINYNPTDYTGAPVALQLTGMRFQDEKIVSAVKKICQILDISRR
ncbi:hypothetical protein HG537_0D04590 [Torulaspora globosa]|uniref:amidase n=1 Tax=Torulaspora globosa TaxID=48254 RepID=A0A7H9HT17_9SACH|nr:hypothetical protein HG537_0D04590 [Torulaspora sp. CBS 2947]